MDFNLKVLGAETVMVDRRLAARIVLAEGVYYRLQELETAESIQKEYLRKSKDGTPVRPLYEVRADYADNPSLSEEENRFIAGRKIQSSRKSRYPTRSAAQGRA